MVAPVPVTNTPHIHLHLGALTDFKKLYIEITTRLEFFCLRSPTLDSHHSCSRLQRNLLSSHTYRFPAGTFRKNSVFPRLMLPCKREMSGAGGGRATPAPAVAAPGSHMDLPHGWAAIPGLDTHLPA